MAMRTKVTRLSNPRRKARRVRRKNRSRRKMSAKQIRIFGTKRQKAALKRKRSVVRNKRKVVKSVNPRRRRSKRPNPAPVLVTLGTVNPRKRRKANTMAKTKRRRKNTRRTAVRRRRRVAVNPRRRRRVARRTNRRRRNPVVIVTRKNRRRRRAVNRRRRHHFRRNPGPRVFGQSITSKNGLMLIGGGLVGVAAAKFVPTLLPSSLGSIGSSNLGRTAITGVSAILVGWAGSKINAEFGAGMLFGGLMQTLSVGLNAFLPAVYKQFGPYAQLGDFAPGQFAVPQNPLRPQLSAAPANMPAPAGSVTVSSGGLGSAYPKAY